MLNWTCTRCDTFNSPRREICWNCGNGRSPSTNNAPATQTPPKSIRKQWVRLLQFFRILGALGAVAILVSLFLPWVIHYAPDRSMKVYAGYMSIYGLITAVLGLILLFFMAKENLAKKWYVLAIVLAIIIYFVSWIPVQVSQVNDAIVAALADADANLPVTIAGIGLSVIYLAVILVIIAAVPQFFRPTNANLADG